MRWIVLVCGSSESVKVSPVVGFNTFAMDDLVMDIPDSLKSITAHPLNTVCADCGVANTEWASLGFGILVCLKCAGFHRSLGTHITSVRAVKLDSWSPEQVRILKLGGNAEFHNHCGDLGMDTDEYTSMKKYGNPKVLYYSAVLKARVEEKERTEYNEADWKETAVYARQVAENFVNNTQETGLSGSTSAEGTPKRTPPRPPADWVPDRAASTCMECQTAFTLFFRRHHCRRCGRTVCANCAPANNNRPIPEWGYTDAVRHCRVCYKSPTIDWKST